MRYLKIIAPVLIILFLAVLLALPAYRARHPYHGDPQAQARWLQDSAQQLNARGSLPADFTKGLDAGEWVSHGFMVFSNGWANFAFNTVHESDQVNDLALLRSSDGKFYVCYFHFCVGEAEFSSVRQPKDVADFLEMFSTRHKWKGAPDL